MRPLGAMGMLLAHELSQPLSTVATYAVAARRMLQSGAGPEPVIDALSKAEAEAQRTREVLERIRDLVSVGRVQPRPVNLVDEALKIRALCMEGANARGVDIAFESPHPIPLVRATRSESSRSSTTSSAMRSMPPRNAETHADASSFA